MVAWLIAHVREASWQTIGLVVLGVYVIAFVPTAFLLPKVLPSRNAARRETEGPNELETQERAAPVSEDLRRRCRELSAELSKLIRQWQEKVSEALQPGLLAKVQREVEGDPDGSLEIKGHDNWLMTEYRERFGIKVLRLSDGLAQRGCITPEIRQRLESPEKPQDVQYIAQRLKLICDEPNED